ncbi:DUF397 domain-containing protein [Streptomyces acidiscabies]|uniref:DUF397 domain-containing protein n=1 Tax=Streptomyces acidiscabies TaxID=42234 RepID=A0AAP6B788_9ACTN|nr:DUF397 domain-containing protein [Streptomyces acidiscabies]MBP5939343.1 DUF397 domain-containing protein [Streptomyces sp. LBUM 1476]MBZ3910477.1 DUF397 domain-containing protein [Streptomyces acidiscabies]MDX2959475.1 DUF397 domain-containing protein [Streptomyces acidiscabies]MDX3019237.1 DUF397 domain-containing protein [Streptomyces acidiscabies]MDX3790682.1 DUF397 domain-containing protein [Streptomyces acidiscabies]
MPAHVVQDAFTLTVSWQKASASGKNGDCVELAPYNGRIAIRDSKSPTGPAILFSRPALLTALETGTF